jgi:hypothetical protein
MNSTENKLDDQVKDQLNHLSNVTPLDPKEVAKERANFLALGESLNQAVSIRRQPRHKEWINQIFLILQRKEYKHMFYTLMTIIVTLTVLFGGAGATVYAAQGSQPDEILYTVKTWSEDVRLSWTNSLDNKLNLTLEFTDRRMAEIEWMKTEGTAIPESITIRFHQHLENALQLAAGMDDPQMVNALARIRERAEVQSQRMLNIMGNGLQGELILTRLQERLREQVQLAVSGETDPQTFRLQVQIREREQINMPTQIPIGTPLATGNSFGPGPENQSTNTPGQYGPGEPNPSHTPGSGDGNYGPGPGTQPTTPAGYGPGPLVSTATCTQAQCTSSPNTNPGNPSATPKPDDPGAGVGQPTATPKQGNDDPSTKQPTESSGKKNGQP